MSDGFTMHDYADLLAAIAEAGYDCLTVREYLTAGRLPERFVVVRHDVTRKPENAERMAELEAEYGVRATYYYRTRTFAPERVGRVEALGHEVGYQYEDYADAGGDTELAHALFRNNLRVFRRACDVDTVCMHDTPLSPYDNQDLWAGADAPGFAEYDLVGDAYLTVDFVDVPYFSDVGRTWTDVPTNVERRAVGCHDKPVSADTTSDLTRLLHDRELDRACLLVHPNRWVDSLPELVVERSKERAANLVKRGVGLFEDGTATS
ncbi:hypothetical protein [Halobacterium wangiae]|uniref:hypothetical protein n=1 Tax=Halobacterium wangiae TaxID=2902623 RepID=UPI001E5F2B3D|nr:hypothetical protein [Halobacterium wangiae]